MPLISKPNYNQVFASQAPEQDKPAVFNNYPLGWGVESRPNNGKPTIKGFNFLQQTSDLKALWILQNGACLPYDESIEYAEGAPVLKDGVIQYKTADGFSPAISEKPYILKYFTEGTLYPLNARVMLENGDIVKSTVAGNTLDPNVDMTGWVNDLEVLDQQNVYPNYGITPAERLKVYVERLPIQAILKTDGTDQTATLKAYIAAAKALSKPLTLPQGIITISDTLLIDFTFHLNGAGRDKTVLRFNNTVQGKPVFSFVRGGTKSVFKDLTLQEKVLHKSVGFKFSDSRTDVGVPLWKCSFYNCEFLCFDTAVIFTSSDPLAGATHAHCSENLFVNCKFSGNKRWVLNQNCQAVNNMFLKCEVENSDTAYLDGQTLTDTNFEFLVDEAGGGFVLIGGSYIGRGRICGWKYPVGGTNLFAGSGTFAGHDMRLECRTTHYGALFEEISGGLTGVNMHYDINVTNMKTLQYRATFDLLRFSGRMSAYFNNVAPVGGAGKLIIRHYPTLGRSATDSTGSLCSVIAENCGLIEYIKETTTPSGTYNSNYTGSVDIRGTRSVSPNSTFVNDAQGWAALTGGGDVSQLAYQYSNVRAFSKLIYNRDWASSGIPAGAQLKIKMPAGGRPLKLFCYKNPTNVATDHTFALYLVKDNANWANPASFNLETDAFSVAVTPSSLNIAGYFEMDVRITTANLGGMLQSGLNNWKEGRMLIVNNGTTSFAGFVGVEYV